MICKWCNKDLSKSQIYSFLRGKSKGNACSKKCSMNILNYGTKDNYIKKHTFKCKNCQKTYFTEKKYKTETCSKKCTRELSSKRMSIQNPMKSQEVRSKVSKKLKEINHKPIIQGGNGRGATKEQLKLYNEINKKDDSFCMEYIESTKGYIKKYKTPNHYKIDIASKIHKIAIEIDGKSHNSLKVKECDNRKNIVLNLKGWKVLRLSNSQINKELEKCVQMVMSMI